MTEQRLIDANALLERIEARIPSCSFQPLDMARATGYREAMKLIAIAPTVEERPKGEWILNEKESKRHIELIYFCSACEVGEAWGDNERRSFCPNCGADMRGEEE